MKPVVVRIVSGGQTGADRGGLDAAAALGIEHGGWCPAGRRAEDGTIPGLYTLAETLSPAYGDRTRANVRDSDATVVFTREAATGGSAQDRQARVAHRHGEARRRGGSRQVARLVRRALDRHPERRRLARIEGTRPRR